MAKQKYYVVWAGRTPGIYTSWAECQTQVNKFLNAKFKAFETLSSANEAYKAGWEKYWGQDSKTAKTKGTQQQPRLFETAVEIDYNSISVDVGTRGNPGPVEYKGVDTQTGEVIFSHGPIAKGTNNLGEFLAIVHALVYLQENGSSKNVYSDSLNAIKWVNQKSVSSTLVRDDSTKEIWGLVDRAEKWLRENNYEHKVMKWDTQRWGEIKADYGRK